jgi:hypothetical protein
LISFHPKFAAWALLELCSFYTVDKRFVFFIQSLILLVFLATHVFVIVAPTFQAVSFFAVSAVEQSDIWLEFKDKTAIGGRTPRSTSSIILDISAHSIGIVFFLYLWCHQIHELNIADFDAAFLIRTLHNDSSSFNCCLDVLMQALVVKDMRAFKEN